MKRAREEHRILVTKVVYSTMKSIQAYTIILLSVLILLKWVSGKSSPIFQLLLRTKDSYGLVLGKDDTFPTDSHIESYPNQLRSYYFSRIRSARASKLPIIFYKLYYWLLTRGKKQKIKLIDRPIYSH